MGWFTMKSILFATIISYGSSIKIGSYNTYQIFTNELASTLLDPQLELIGDSDLDVICLQELFTFPTTTSYLTSLAQKGYTESYSMLNVDPPQLPKIPCNQTQIDAILSTQCSPCNSLYGDSTYAGCLALVCPDQFEEFIYTDCAGCLTSYPTFQPTLSALDSSYTLDINGAAVFCLPPAPLAFLPDALVTLYNIPFEITEGTAVVSKPSYPIMNGWSYTVPSWLFIQRRVNIVEINICADTNPYNADCGDSIIIGCTHLEPTGYIEDEGIVQSPGVQDSNPEITSHIGLNQIQTEYILDEIFNDDILETLGRDNDKDSVYGVFLMGDINTGELFSRCEYLNDQGELNADNCNVEPLNPYDLFAQNGLINGRDIKYNAKPNEGAKCTLCIDPSSPDDDFNLLAADDDGTFFNDPIATRDLDHILVQDGYCNNFKSVKFARDFLDKIVEIDGECPGVPDEVFGICIDLCDNCTDGQLCCSNGCGNVCKDVESQLIPASDHYAVTLDIEFERNGGGRCNDVKCTRDGKKGGKKDRKGRKGNKKTRRERKKGNGY